MSKNELFEDVIVAEIYCKEQHHDQEQGDQCIAKPLEGFRTIITHI